MGATKHYTLLAYDQNCLDEVTIRVQGQLPPGAVMSAQTKGSSPVQVCRKYLCAPPCVRACFRDPAGGCALAWFCVCAHARDRVIREVKQARVRVWIIAYIKTRCNAVCTPPKNAHHNSAPGRRRRRRWSGRWSGWRRQTTAAT